MANKPKLIQRNRPTVAEKSSYGSSPNDDRWSVIIDGVATSLTTAGFTVYKRKTSMIMESDVFPCVIVSPSEEGEITGQMALDKVYYIQKYNRDLTYESQLTRYDIRKAIYKLANVSGTLSPTSVDVRGIPPFNVDNPVTTWKVTGFRLTYGFFEQGDI